MKAKFIFIFLLQASLGFSGVVSDTIYINSGFLVTATDSFYVLSYNDSPTFNQSNYVINIDKDDTLLLSIKNNHSQKHNFNIDGISGIDTSAILFGSFKTISISGLQPNAYIFYDNYVYNSYLGLKSVLVVKDYNYKHYVLNVREFMTDWNDKLFNSVTPTSSYLPNCFTVNGKSYPDTKTDSLSKIVGNVGDTIIVYMVNSGLYHHAMHTHGYHILILKSNKEPHKIGRSKDSIALYTDEVLMTRVVPDQPGMYPIHDHNLISVTNGGNYPGGMITMFHIMP